MSVTYVEPPAETLDEQATVFACYLLMPEHLWAVDMKKGVDFGDDNAVLKLARKYRVPVAAVVMRYTLWKEHDR